MVIKTKATWDGFSQNKDGVVKFVLHLPYTEIAASIQCALLVDKVLEVKVKPEDGAEELWFQGVTFYNLTLKKDGDAKVVFRVLREDVGDFNFSGLNGLLDSNIDVVIHDSDVDE